MQTLTRPETGQMPRTRPILDLLVVNACDLVIQKQQIYQKIRWLANHTQRAPDRRGLWLFLVIRSSPEMYALERATAWQVTSDVTGWCQGAITVEERTPALTARAVLEFHQLHFPHVRAKERASRILVLGSEAELALSRTYSTEELI